MDTKKNTPPHQQSASILFPLTGNRSMINKLAISHGITVYPEYNAIFFTGSIPEVLNLKGLLKGGVIA